MSPYELLDSAFCVRLTLTLAHFLWQGLAIGVLAALAGWCLRRRSAQSRYLVHVTALLLMAACLPVTFALVRGTATEPIASAPEATDAPMAEPVIPEPFVAPPTEAIQPSPPVVEPAEDMLPPRFEPGPVEISASTSGEQHEPLLTALKEEPAEAAPVAGSRWKAVTPYATSVYFAGVLVMLVRLWLALHGGRRLRRHARPVEDHGLLEIVKRQARLLGLRFVPMVAYCERVAVPVVVGVLRPMILLPVALTVGLTPDQLTAIITHELTHLRRHDHWVNIVQRVVEAVLFFHPAVWYVSRRITVHREHCCDDAVVATGQQCGEYAESLIRVAELSLQIRGLHGAAGCTALGVSDRKRSRLRDRVVRLMGGRPREQFRLGRTWPLATLLIAGALIACMAWARGESPPTADNAATEEAAQNEPEEDADGHSQEVAEGDNGAESPKGPRIRREFVDIADFLEHFQPKLPEQWHVSWLLHCNIGHSRETSCQGVFMRLCRPSWMDYIEKPGWHSVIYPQTTPETELPQETPAIEPDTHIAIMSEGYEGKGPRTEELGPGRELARWRGRRVFVWNDRTHWPGMEAAVVAAFKAADNRSDAAKATPLSGLCRDVAALLGELVPRLPAKWDVYKVEPITSFFDERPFSMAFVHQDKRELYGHLDGAYLDLDTFGVPEIAAPNGGNVPLATWRGRKVYVSRVGRGWPTHEKDILAALRASDTEDVELDKRRVWIGPVTQKDDLPPGLLIGGPFGGSFDGPPEVRYRLTRNSSPWKNPLFFFELLGRLPGEYRYNDRFEVVRYYRRGNHLALTYRRGKPDPEMADAPKPVYLYAPLPDDLKPGEYTVEVVGADPKEKLPRLDHSFEVPDVAASPEAASGTAKQRPGQPGRVSAAVAAWLQDLRSDDPGERLEAIRKAGNWVVNGTHPSDALYPEDPAARRRAAAQLDAGGRQEIIGSLLDRLEKNVEDRTGYKDGVVSITRSGLHKTVRVESENEALANALRLLGVTRAVPLLKRAHAFQLKQQPAEERPYTMPQTFAFGIYMLSMERVGVWENRTMKPFEPGPSLEEQARQLLRPDLKPTRGLTASLSVSSASRYPKFFVGDATLVAVLTVTNHSDRPIPVDLSPETITFSCVGSGRRINIPATEMVKPVVGPAPQTLAPKGATSCTWHIKRLKDSPLGHPMKSGDVSVKVIYSPTDKTVRKQWGTGPLVSNTLNRPYFDHVRPDSAWHLLQKGNLVTVDVERALYEKPGQPHFFVRVRLTNVTDRPVGVDLRDDAELVYPNQWGPQNVDHRRAINERRRQYEPLEDAARAKLPADFRDGKLTVIPAGEAIDYYREFNASGRADVENQLAGYKYLLVSLDGVLRVSDGARVAEISCSWDRADNSHTDLLIATPVPWRRIPAGAEVKTTSKEIAGGALVEHAQASPAEAGLERALPVPDHWDKAKLQDALATELKRLADEKLPGHAFTQEKSDPNGTIRIAWKTQKYDVPRATGKQTNAPVVTRRETGPAADGLILTVWISDALGAADRSHTRDNAGIWKTHLGHNSAPSLKKHLLYNVDYGPETDKRLIELFSSPDGWLAAADGKAAGTTQRTLPREEELALLDLLQESELIVVGTLRRTDDSTANKMWAGHIDVEEVLLGDPSLRDVHVHFQHPTARRGAARRETGQAGIWFVYGDFRQVVWPRQLRPISFEKTLRPYLKRFLEEEIERLSKAGSGKDATRLGHLRANYEALPAIVPPPARRAAVPDGEVTMQLSYVVSKPVPVPPATTKLFREIVARPPARSFPELPSVAEWTARFQDDGSAYEWYGNVIRQRTEDERKCWGCPRLAVLWRRMMKQRAHTDEKLKATLEEFEKDLKQGKIPTQDEKTLRALEKLAAAKTQLQRTVGGTWETQTRDEHPLGPVLVGQVEAEHAGQTHLAAYVLLPFRYDAFGRTRVWAQYRAGSHTLRVLGTNERCTVLSNMSSQDLSVSRDVMKALGLSKPKVTVAAMSIAHLWQQSELWQQGEKLCVDIEWVGPETQGLPCLRMTTSKPGDIDPAWLSARMTLGSGRSLVDHFLEQGMLDPFDSSGSYKPVRGPFCLLRIRGPAAHDSTEELVLVNVLGWGPPLRQHLDGLRESLLEQDKDAIAVMDKLLDGLKRKEAPSPEPAKGETNIRFEPGATPAIGAAALKSFETTSQRIAWGEPKDGVACGLSVGSEPYVLGDPVELIVYLENKREKEVTCKVSNFHGAWVRGPRDDELYMMVDAQGEGKVEGKPHTIPPGEVRRVLVTECPTRPTGNHASDLHFTPGRTRVVVRCTPLFDETDGGIFADKGYGACTGPVTVEVVEPPKKAADRLTDDLDLLLTRIKAQLAAVLPPTMTVTRAEIAEHALGAGLLLHASPKETGEAHPSFALFFWPRANENDCPYQPTAGVHTFRPIGTSKQFLVYYSGPAGVLRDEIIRTFCTETTSDAALDRIESKPVKIAVAQTNPSAIAPAAQPAADSATQPGDRSEPYRQLYARYKQMILKAVRAGDADEVAKLTSKFNETLGGKLLYVRVQKLKPGEQEQWEMLLSKFFTEKQWKLPIINYPMVGQPHVSFWDGYILILPTKLGGGRYEDNVYIEMAVEPATAPLAAQPVADSATMVAEALQRIHKRVAALEEQHPALKGIANAKPQFGGVSAFTSREADWSFANNATEWGKAETPSAVDPSKAFCRIILRMWTPSGPTVDSQPVADQRDYQVGGVPWGGYLKVWSNDSKLVEAVKAIVDEELDRATTSRLAAASQEEEADKTTVVTRIDKDALLKELRGVGKRSREDVGPGGWAASFLDAKKGEVFQFAIAVCSSREAAKTIYRRREHLLSVPPMPLVDCKVGDIRTSSRNWAFFVRDNVFVSVSWKDGIVDAPMLERLDKLLMTDSPLVARGQFSETPELKGLPATLEMTAAETKSLPVTWAGMGRKPAMWYVSSPGSMSNQVVDTTVQLKVSPGARENRHPVTVYAVGEGLVFATATVDVTIKPATTQPAAQPASPAKPGLRLRIDPKKLRLYNLSLADVRKALAEQKIAVAGGRVDAAGQHELNLDPDRLPKPEDLRRIVVTTQAGLSVPLEQFAEIFAVAGTNARDTARNELRARICLAATREAIGREITLCEKEIATYERLLDDGSRKQLSRMQNRLKQLREQAAHYAKLTPDEYRLPVPVHLEQVDPVESPTWTRCDLGEGLTAWKCPADRGLLYYVGMSKSGPFYRAVAAAAPIGKVPHQAVEVYPLFRSAYGFPEYYAYVEPIPAKSPAHEPGTVNLSAAISGRIATVDVELGQSVLKGQLLVTLDNSKLKASIMQAQAESEARRHAATTLRKKLANGEGPAEDAARATAEVARADAHLDRLKDELLKCEIRSPVNGTVTYSPGKVSIGKPVRPGDRLFTIRPDDATVPTTHRVASGASKPSVDPDIAWGPAVEGVQCRLQPDRAVWKAADVPTFRVDVRNNGPKAWVLSSSWMLVRFEVDGRWYVWSGPVSAQSTLVKPGQGLENVAFGTNCWRFKAEEAPHQPLKFTPGRHTIRVAFHSSPEDATKSKSIRVMSNPVEIEVLFPDGDKVTAAPKASFDAAELAQAHARTIKGVLPVGWTVKADGDVVTIRRNEKVQGDPASPVAPAPNEITWTATIEVRVGPRISMAEYCRMASANETARKEDRARHPNLSTVNYRIKLPHSLPTHLDAQSSLWISGGYLDNSRFEFKSKDVAEECRRVYETIKGMSRPYTPEWGSPVNGLQAGLDLERPAQAATGNLRLLFRLRNAGDKPAGVLRLSAQARFWGENLPIEVIDLRDGRKVMKYRGPVLEPPPPPPSEQYIQLAPGGIDSVEVEMNPAHWGTEDLSKVHAGFIFSNAHETENPGPGWPVITGLWTGRAMSPRIPLAPGTPRKPEDPKAAFVMPDVAYKRALDSYVSTGPRYILVTLVNATTGQSRAACIEPGALLGAIQREKAYARDVEGWNRTMAFALAQKDRTFRFSDPEACKRASPRYTPEILAEVRQRVNEMTTDEMVKEIGDQESNLYRFCVEGREGAYPYLDSVAHVLMERGIACGRSCKPGLLDVYGKMDEQQALPPAAQPTPPKTEDLSDRLKIEVNPPDNLPGGLYAVGPFDIGRGQSPDAHLLYQWRVEKKIGDGHEQLVGRLPLDVYGLGSRGGGSVEVLKFTRIGNRILGTLKHTLPLRGAKFPANSIYLRAFLPKLPAGEYEVEIRFEEHYHTGDGKISPAPEGTLPQMRPMTCKFQVPDKTAATRKPPSGSGEDEGNVDKAPWGEAVRGVQVRLQADKAAWDTTEVPVVKVDVQNNGKDEFHLIGWMVTNCFAHIDGVTYLGGCSAACPAPGDTMTGISIKLGGSTTVANGFSRVPRSSTSGEGDLRWSPGKHTVRVSFRMAPRGAPDNTPHVEVFSNPVTIEVAAVATDVPEHLRNWPGLFDRAGDKIVNAPPDDVKVAKGYVAFADKGKVHKGRRVTIMSAKRQYTVGEEVRVIHVLEAVEPGGEVFVMGPKTVFGEYIDGKDVTKDLPKPAGYNGRVLNSPAVDYNYAITEYTFDKPGEHTIQWKAAGPFDGEGLVSNVLNLVVVAAARASEESDDPAQWSKPALGLMGRLVVAAPRITTSEQFDLSLELRNNHFGGGPWLAVQEGNPFLFEVSVTDAGGKAVKPTMTRRDVLYSPKWQVIRPFPDERLSIPVSIRSVDGAKGSHLDTTTSIWKLSPGVYKIAATFTSPKEIRYKGEATPWTGKLELPPVEVEVVAADGDAPDINANVDNELRWGAPHLGLRCRLESGKAQVPMGATVDFQLHPRYDPSTTLDEQIGLLNRCDEAFDATLTFTETQTGKVFRRSPYDAGMPPSGPGVDDIVQLREDTMGPDRLEVYLLSDTGEQIPPGEYRVVATYDNTGQPKVEVSVAPDGSVITKPYEGPWEFWKGKIDSAPAILTVTEVEPEEIDIKVNSALTIKHQKDGTKDTIGWSWSQDAPMRVRVTHRPGYTLGRRYSYQILLGGKQIGNVGDRGGLAGGAWDNGGGMSFLAPELVKRVLAGEKLTLRADVEIFETSMPPQHMWSPTAGDFKVLWKGQIEGAL